MRDSPEPSDQRPARVGRARIWAPLVIAYVGGTLELLFEKQIGEFLDVCNPLMGCLAAEIYAGAPIGFVAALASRTWTGLLTFILGLSTAGATLALVIFVNGHGSAGVIAIAPFYFAFWLGLLGVPTYAIVTGIVYTARWIARAARPPSA